MPNTGDYIDYNAGNISNQKGFYHDGGDHWFSDAWNKDMYYLYISAASFRAELQTNWNLFGTAVFDAWVDTWDGSKWVTVIGPARIDNVIQPFFMFYGNHIYRLRYQAVSGNFLEWLQGGLQINGYSYVLNDPEDPVSPEEYYNSTLRSRQIARVANGNQYYGGKCHTDYKPYDDPVADIYDTTAFRGSPITASVPVCCFVQATGRNDY